MGHCIRMALAAVTLTSCSFIDDFDFEVADGAVAADGFAPEDASVPDGAVADGGETPDGNVPTPCTDPCLGDAVEDFGGTQGAGALGWRYLRDERAPLGLAYAPLTAGTLHGAPAWTAESPPPAIVNCGDSSEAGCSIAEGRLLFEADQPGGGSDPVLSFVAPADGTYAVVADVGAVAGLPSLTLSRMARHDVIATADFAGAGSLTDTIDLFAGERALITAAPAADPGGPASLAAQVRVSRHTAAAPFAECLLAARFSPEPLGLGCAPGIFLESGGVETVPTLGPGGEYGDARLFPEGASLEADGLRMDYSGAFTIQLWFRVDDLEAGDPLVFSDLVASDPTNAGGVNLAVRRAADDQFEATYAFPLAGAPLGDEPSISCDPFCRGTISVASPPLGEWHFFRLVRRTDVDEVRLCIDGEQVGTGWLDRDVAVPSPGDVKLGTSGVGAPRFEGAIDDVRVFSRALPCGD